MISIGSTILLVLALLALASFENLWPLLVACIAAVLFLLIGYPLWILVHTQWSKRKENQAQAKKTQVLPTTERGMETDTVSDQQENESRPHNRP